MDINLNSVYFLSQAAAKVMVTQGSGKIINIASMLSSRANWELYHHIQQVSME
mgnify:CR=1 FL=1